MRCPVIPRHRRDHNESRINVGNRSVKPRFNFVRRDFEDLDKTIISTTSAARMAFSGRAIAPRPKNRPPRR